MSQRKPIAEVLKDKNLSKKRKDQIKQVVSIRKFAHKRLKLPKNNSYTTYVDLKRKAITWNLIATPKYNVDPIKTCFPITGCVSYLMYFSHNHAKLEAQKHKNAGHDTYLIASPAYSTGGTFDDPIVSTMFRGGVAGIAQTVFHELAHQRLYRKNKTAFNEAFASAIGEQGTILWLQENHPKKLKGYKDYLRKRIQFYGLMLATRDELKALYKTKIPATKKAHKKKRIIQALREKYVQLKKSWGGDRRFDAWFDKGELNNAKLAVIGVYYQKVPEFTKRLKALNYDFERFYKSYENKN